MPPSHHKPAATESAAFDKAILTPAMRQLVDNMERVARHHPPLHTLSAAEARARSARADGLLDIAPPALARVEDLRIPARDGVRLPARLYAPSATAARLPALLYLHGGGFTLGSIESHDVHCRALALAGGVAVVSLQYRLAPEHRFPTAVNDSWDALQWLAAPGSGGLGLDAARLAVGGDSAGGTLAAVAAIAAHRAGLPLALQLLIYPGTAARQDTPSHARFANAPVLDKTLIDWFFAQYIDPADRTDWRFAPLLADDAEGLPPAWIGLAEIDPLHDDGILYADKLRAAGVPVALEIYRGVVHGFVTMSRAIPEARQLWRDAGNALRAAFAQ